MDFVEEADLKKCRELHCPKASIQFSRKKISQQQVNMYGKYDFKELKRKIKKARAKYLEPRPNSVID